MGLSVKTNPANSTLYPTPPSSPSKERFASKVANSSLGSQGNAQVNWAHSRRVTPGGMCGYHNGNGVEFFNFYGEGSVQLFRSGQNSHGLISDGKHIIGASVTSSIKTETNRKAELKGTFIQYDKTRVIQKKADFTVDATNYRGWVNYQGGHLIDHKYSADNSHYLENNYIPVHYVYNAPLKEYLVQRCERYLEIPLYTPHPPRIGVKGQKGHSHPIPVGIIFIQISKEGIQDIYYFPNNDFDYKKLKDDLGVEKDIAEAIIPYFKLRKSFHPLFRCAMLYDLKEGKSKQVDYEEKAFEMMDTLSWGMSLADCSEEQALISQFSFSVLHEKDVDPSLCLACEEDDFARLEGQPLAAPFNALGEFLVQYGLKNAVKSEALSTNARLIFLNVLIDFIEGHSQVSEKALEYVDSLAEQFKFTLNELEEIAPTMTQEELFYLANTYQRLSSEFNHAFAMEGHEILDDDDMMTYFNKSIKVMQLFTSKFPIEADFAWNFLNFIEKTQEILDYWIETGSPKHVFQEERTYLKSQASQCKKLLSPHLNNEEKEVYAEFQSNINRKTIIKAAPGYLKKRFETLG